MIGFQQRLQELMDNVGVSQTQLSDATGIDRSKLNRLVNGKSEPSVAELLKLAKYFNLPPAGIVCTELLEDGRVPCDESTDSVVAGCNGLTFRSEIEIFRQEAAARCEPSSAPGG